MSERIEPRTWEWIKPARWRTSMPGLGSPKGEEDLRQKVRQQGPASFDELKRIIEDLKEDRDLRYEAMGFLVTLHGYANLQDDQVIPVLLNVVTSASEKPYDEVRSDALYALASLRGSSSIAKLIAFLDNPKSNEHLRRDAYLALAHRKDPDPRSVEHLALGILELSDIRARSQLARALGEIRDVSWEEKAKAFLQLLGKSSKHRSDMDSAGVIHALALSSGDEALTRHLHKLADFFIEAAVDKDERMSGILAELLIECVGGSPDQAGSTINLYQRNHGLPETALQNLRIQVGGTPALSGILGVLQKDLEEYFQKPIHALNENTRTMWQQTLSEARQGFRVRIWMSAVVFGLGTILGALSSLKIIFGSPGTGSQASIYFTALAGLLIMLLVTYTGPLKEIRQSVTDLATASAAFIAYVHRVLETSHTFSYYYLKEKISFEEMKKSCDLIKEAMNNTIEELNRKAIDSSEEVIKAAAEIILRQQGTTVKQSEPAKHEDRAGSTK